MEELVPLPSERGGHFDFRTEFRPMALQLSEKGGRELRRNRVPEEPEGHPFGDAHFEKVITGSSWKPKLGPYLSLQGASQSKEIHLRTAPLNVVPREGHPQLLTGCIAFIHFVLVEGSLDWLTCPPNLKRVF